MYRKRSCIGLRCIRIIGMLTDVVSYTSVCELTFEIIIDLLADGVL